MSNHPRPAKPPLPLLKRSKSGTVPATRGDAAKAADGGGNSAATGRSGTIAAVRPEAAASIPRPTHVLRGLEKSNASTPKAAAPEPAAPVTPRGRRHEPVLRRLDPAFSAGESWESWEARGTRGGVPYRDSMPTIPSPEELESRLLAQLTQPEPKLAAAKPKPTEVRARAHFEPAHPPAASTSAFVDLEKAVPVIVDPFSLVSASPAPGALEVDVSAPGVPIPEAVVTDATEPSVAVAVVTESVTEAEDDLEPPDAVERSRITLPPARRRRPRRRRLRALFLGVLVLGGAVGAGWYRFPVECEQGWRQAQAELTVWQGTLAHQWVLGTRAFARWRSQ